MENVDESFNPTVIAEWEVFGVPIRTAMGGGILYNKKVYADLGLSVPTTWDEFAANNEKIKAAGIAPVIATYDGDFHLDFPVVRACRLLQRRAGLTRTSPRTTPPTRLSTLRLLRRWPVSATFRKPLRRAGTRRTLRQHNI